MMVAEWLESSFGGKDLFILVHVRLGKSQQCTLGEKTAMGITSKCQELSLSSLQPW